MIGNLEECPDAGLPEPDRTSASQRQRAVWKGGSPLLARHAFGALVTLLGTFALSLVLGFVGWGDFAAAIFLFVAMEGILANNGIAAFIIQNPNLKALEEATGNTLQFLVGALTFCVSLGLSVVLVLGA